MILGGGVRYCVCGRYRVVGCRGVRCDVAAMIGGYYLYYEWVVEVGGTIGWFLDKLSMLLWKAA